MSASKPTPSDSPSPRPSTYETDFYAWTHQQQAELLRQGRLGELDTEHLIEELGDMGASRESELESRLGVLLAHLLKWQFQPERRGSRWEATMREQRRRVARLLRKNPSLKAVQDEAFVNAYGDARLIAMRETGLSHELFPAQCPYGWEQMLDDSYWPD